VSGPKFSSQTKEKLVGFAIDTKGQKTGQLGDDLQLELEKPEQAIERYIMPWIVNEFKKNKSFPKAILDRATSVAKAREQSKELMKAASKLKVRDKHDPLPDVLYTATKAPAEQREIFIVEGDSAGGCFTVSTPVLQADGAIMTFGEMVERQARGEKMFSVSWDTETQQQVIGEFDEPRLTKYVNELVEVELSDGTKFVCTTDHPWLLGDGTTYVAAENLQVGQELKWVDNSSRD
jgi:DNA gyrase subunit B